MFAQVSAGGRFGQTGAVNDDVVFVGGQRVGGHVDGGVAFLERAAQLLSPIARADPGLLRLLGDRTQTATAKTALTTRIIIPSQGSNKKNEKAHVFVVPFLLSCLMVSMSSIPPVMSPSLAKYELNLLSN